MLGLVDAPELSVTALLNLADVSGPIELAAYFVAIFVATAIATFFNAALVSCTRDALAGTPVSVRAGLAAAWRVKHRILVYALATATIGVVIQLLDEKLHVGGRLAAWLFSMGWSVLTFFIVPVMVLDEEAGLGSMFRTSGDTFIDTWGESLTADFGIGLVGLLVFLSLLVPGVMFVLRYGHPWVIGGLLAICFLTISLFTHALGYIVRTELYRYAHDGPEATSLGVEPQTLFDKS